ncbi:MAG: N-acyl homoserine lactonase family protein [Rhodovarius sp.]|nr:N-acyl homoserine lactonase family protein [Rhodovarius sp.]
MIWQAFAIRYARHDRLRRECHVYPVPDPHEAMPLDFYVWLLRAEDGQEVLVDTGYDLATAERRGRPLGRRVDQALAAIGSDAARIADVVISHLHWDHVGSLDQFPAARFHIQERELHFATGRHMCSRAIRFPFECEHVVAMIRALYADRVVVHTGSAEIAPGLSLHRVGGHSDGLQVVRVMTARGPIVIASDALHFWANVERENPFPIIFDLGEMVQGWRIVRELAGGLEHAVIPGHDPLVLARFPHLPGQEGEVALLHEAPLF